MTTTNNLIKLPWYQTLMLLVICAQTENMKWAKEFETRVFKSHVTADDFNWITKAVKYTFDKLPPNLRTVGTNEIQDIITLDWWTELQRDVTDTQSKSRSFTACSGPWGKLEIERCYG